jgi:hypothetical protein
MSVRDPLQRSWIALLAIVSCALAAAAVEQHAVGWNELSHFAQVRAFANGTPRIDRFHHSTGDRAFYQGHWYSDKAPGLALFVLPVYKLVPATDIVKPAGYGALHVLVVWGCTLPFLVIMLLAYFLVERKDPGQGVAVALTLGLGTILLPFATMLFSHVFSACLGFTAFLLLDRERRRDQAGDGLGLVAAAGLLCGYALATEYPLAVLVALLGLYVGWRPRPLTALLVFGGGVFVGLIPLFAYDWWAFGSPLHLSYESVAANSSGVLGLGAPSLASAVRLLVSERGLFVVTPVTAAAIAGIVMLYREGRRMDALVPAAVIAGYFAYDVCYYLPFGGSVPGPRFLITMLPFLALPLAATHRRAPLATLSLAAISAATMIAATVTLPILSLYSSNRVWWRMLERGSFTTRGDTIYVFAFFALLAVLAAALATARPRVTRLDLKLTAFAIGSWLVIERAGPTLLAHDAGGGHPTVLVVVIAVSIALVAVLVQVARGSRLALVAGLPLAALAVRGLDRTTLGLILALASIALLAALSAIARPQRRVAV